MRFRVKPSPDVAAEIKRFEKSDLVELMRRAAIRMHDGDADEHIERAVAWEGHSEAFSKWLVQEVRASFMAIGFSRRHLTTLELWARAAARLAILMVLILFGKFLMLDRDSPLTIVALVPVVLLGFFYSLGLFVAVARLVNRLMGKDSQEPEK
jgi:hypothetical protein